jgi:hypothetical protein
MIHRVLVGMLWLGAMVVAFLLGWVTRVPSDGSTETRTALERHVHPMISPVETLRFPDPLAREEAFARSAEAMESGEEFLAAFGELLPDFESGTTHDALFVLADAWAAREPAAACAWLDELDFNDPRNPYLFAALSQWASADPQAARAWFDATRSDPGAVRDHLLAALVRGIARNDPAEALRTLLAMPNSPERTGSIDFLVQAWRREDVEAAMTNVAELPDSERSLKGRAIRQLVDALSPDDLATARSWAGQLADPQARLDAHAAIAAHWSRHDPTAATGWAAAIDDPAIRCRALGEAATRWARIDPPAAADWLAAHAGRPDHDLAARAVAWSTVGLAPAVAFKQVAMITTESLRDETFEQLGRIWVTRQPQIAKNFLESDSPIPPAIRSRLLEHFE